MHSFHNLALAVLKILDLFQNKLNANQNLATYGIILSLKPLVQNLLNVVKLMSGPLKAVLISILVDVRVILPKKFLFHN